MSDKSRSDGGSSDTPWIEDIQHGLIPCDAVSLPGALVAIYVGRIINRRLRGHAFLIYLHVGLIAVGGVLLAQANGI
ncbi:MAG TPA: hypothetical protein VK797_16250 [Tepidisphaeraceae bacterium]|jgi:hypothetical protein|nr:hypothetical protein [Tepidisphaeraceae bacterium]